MDVKGFVPFIPPTHFITLPTNWARDVHIVHSIIDLCDIVVLCIDGEGTRDLDLPTKAQLAALEYAKRTGKPVITIDAL